MAKTNLKTVSGADNFIWIGKKKYTKMELALHGVAIYEKMYLNNENQLEYYNELGNIFIQTLSSYGNNLIEYGKWINSCPLSIVTVADRSDCKKIAENWDKVKKLNKAGLITALGVNSVRKALTKNYPEIKKPKSAGNTSKNKKATTKAKAKPVALPKNEQELAAMVQKIMQQEGFNKASFTKELNKLYKK
tara:strand:- start:267 stop:839 length:573 start_codon:yes stop_codon:yes gene_type:complete